MTHPKGTVIFDPDDTCGNMKVRIEGFLRRYTGDNTINSDDWMDYGVERALGISTEKFFELIMEDRSIEVLEPHDGLKEVTAAVRERGYRVVFVTARAWHPNAYEITTKWLDAAGATYDEVRIVPLDKCKESVTRDIEDIVLFVDDRVDHCKAMVDSGRVQKSLMYAQPWNAYMVGSLTDKLGRVDNLYEVLEYLPN